MTRPEDGALADALAHLATCQECQVHLMAAFVAMEVEDTVAEAEAIVAEAALPEFTAVWTCGLCGHTLHAEVDGVASVQTMGMVLMDHTWTHHVEAGA